MIRRLARTRIDKAVAVVRGPKIDRLPLTLAHLVHVHVKRRHVDVHGDGIGLMPSSVSPIVNAPAGMSAMPGAGGLKSTSWLVLTRLVTAIWTYLTQLVQPGSDETVSMASLCPPARLSRQVCHLVETP